MSNEATRRAWLIIIFRDVLDLFKERGPDPRLASTFQIRYAVDMRLHWTPVLEAVRNYLSMDEQSYNDWIEIWKNYQNTGAIPDYPDNF